MARLLIKAKTRLDAPDCVLLGLMVVVMLGLMVVVMLGLMVVVMLGLIVVVLPMVVVLEGVGFVVVEVVEDEVVDLVVVEDVVEVVVDVVVLVVVEVVVVGSSAKTLQSKLVRIHGASLADDDTVHIKSSEHYPATTTRRTRAIAVRVMVSFQV